MGNSFSRTRIGCASAALLCASLSWAAAEEAIAELGDARVTYDGTRWHAVARPQVVEFEPIGDAMRRADPVALRVLDDGESCHALALQAFAVGHYETDALTPTPVTVGGVAGERFEAHTGCRNATPIGAVICVKYGGFAYLVQSLNAGCGGKNLFSASHPLDEVVAGISFAAAAR